MTATELIQIIERFAWDALQQQARNAAAGSHDAFSRPGSSRSLESAVRDLCQGSGIPLIGAVDDEIVRSAVGEVFCNAKALGLVMFPTSHVRDMNPGSFVLEYQFTERGIGFLRNGEISLSAPGLLVGRVREIAAAGSVDPGIVPLAEEAQRCWSMGCLRASMVMIGLASEEACSTLLDELCNYPSPPQKGGKLHQDWEKLNNESWLFHPKWQSGLALMESAKAGLKKAYGAMKPDWWRTWEPLPGAVQPYAEAVRIARNTAAHSVDDIFTPAQVGLLLASLPTMLGVVSDLTK